MSGRHLRRTRTKLLVGTVGAVVVAAAAIIIPQASAAGARSASIPGTAWALDPATGQMVVTADRTVTGERWNTLITTASARGARVERSAGEFRLFADGGDAIFAGGARCSLGFNVTTSDNRPGFLTAGHCGVAADRWSLSQNGRAVAQVQEATFPGNGDFALLTYDNPNTRAPGTVDIGNRTVNITGAANARVGQRVFRMGSTSGLHSGRVTALNATVNYPEGTVTGLIQTTVCAEPGDSGGSLFTQTGSAIGLTSGGSGDCRTGGVTFFQPVTRALAAVGAEINTSDGN